MSHRPDLGEAVCLVLFAAHPQRCNLRAIISATQHEGHVGEALRHLRIAGRVIEWGDDVGEQLAWSLSGPELAAQYIAAERRMTQAWYEQRMGALDELTRMVRAFLPEE